MKIPPQNLDAERAVIGACMFNRKYYDRADTIITTWEMFYKPAHGIVWKSMSTMTGPMDFFLVRDRLERDGMLEEVGGLVGLAEITDGLVNSENVEHYAGIVREMWLRRKQIMIARELEARAFDPTLDIFESMDAAEKGIQEMSGSSSGLENALDVYYGTVGPRMEEAVKRRELALKEGRSTVITGIPSGLDCIDQETGGAENTDLIIVAARPAMGKTHMMLRMARTASVNGVPVAIFSLEMDKSQLVQRIVSYDSDVNTRDMRQGNLTSVDWERMQSATASLGNMWIDDTGSVNVGYIRSRARAARKSLFTEWKKKNPRKKPEEFRMVVLVDYLQLISGQDRGRNGTREQEVSAIARGLKALAKELKCPVIVLSQLSRAVETRGGDKRPILSDLKESGDIEAAADMVLLLYRAEYYGLTVFEDGRSTKDVGEVIIAKYRHGRVGTYEAEFTGRGGWRNNGERGGSTQNDLFLPEIKPKPIDFSRPKHAQEDDFTMGDNNPPVF